GWSRGDRGARARSPQGPSARPRRDSVGGVAPGHRTLHVLRGALRGVRFVTRPRCRQAIGLGLLLPGLFLAHPDLPEAAVPPKKTSPRPHTPQKPPPMPKPPPGPAGRARESNPAAPIGRTVHVVRSGETLTRIAVRYGVSRKALIDANRLARPEQLRVGQ